jgi:predicted thioredoxin/glutaredoxin
VGAELPAGLAVITREGCTLCDAMFEALAELRQRMTLPPVVAVDVDGDPDLARRYGHKVPVLVCDGAVVCHYQLDEAELRRILARWAP